MQRQGQKLGQKQSLQQKLSPQQIQYIKLLQLPTIALEQRIKEEMEMNPVLEETEPVEVTESIEEIESEWEQNDEKETDEPDPVDQNEEIDWDSFLHNNAEYDGQSYGTNSYGDEDWRDLPNPYHETLLEELENQVSLLDLNDTEKLIADQILGSLDADGYFRREPEAVVDNIAFNHGALTSEETVEKVRQKIQKLEPVGIASRDLRDCLLVQMEHLERDDEIQKLALEILRNEWSSFERKHFTRMKTRLNIDDRQLKEVFQLIQSLDPKPGAVTNPDEDSRQFIEPDFEVYFAQSKEGIDKEDGEFIIQLNQRNIPPLRISPHYKEMWDELKKKKTKEKGEARSFIKEKVESAQWFIESIRQRQKTLMDTMRTIVALQENFFKYGDGLKPMILKDIAERVHLDISTISRVVNGKYVQTSFGVYELKYFFSEGLQTESGEEVSSHEVKNLLEDFIRAEDKTHPCSDQELTRKLQERGYKVARRTVSKYREQLNLPVARLRKQLI